MRERVVLFLLHLVFPSVLRPEVEYGHLRRLKLCELGLLKKIDEPLLERSSLLLQPVIEVLGV